MEWDPPPSVVTMRWLRAVPFGDLDGAAGAEVRQTWGQKELEVSGPPKPGAPAHEHFLTAFQTDRRPGRLRRPDDFFLELAEQYVGLLPSPHVVVDLAQSRNQSTANIRNLLMEARERSADRPLKKGVADGALTPEAIRLRRQLDAATPRPPANTRRRESGHK